MDHIANIIKALNNKIKVKHMRASFVAKNIYRHADYLLIWSYTRGRRGRDCMVVEFTINQCLSPLRL